MEETKMTTAEAMQAPTLADIANWRYRLTKTEFAILACLHGHPGEYVTIATMTREVYGYSGAMHEGNLVRMHISNIRRALGDLGEIATRPSVGYLLARLDGVELPPPPPPKELPSLRVDLTPLADQMAAAFAAVRS